jgi:S1-C subfamily serine protease
MVKHGYRLRGASLATGGALMACGMAAAPGWAKQAAPAAITPPVPAREQRSSLLEQMQDEVALIASQARSGIVTIEDARAIVYNWTESPLRKTDLQEQITHLEIDRKAVQEKYTQSQTLSDAGHLTKFELDKARHNLAKIEAQLAALQRALANTESNDPLTQRRQEIDDRIAELEIDRKFYTEQEKIVQQKVNAGIAKTEDLIEAKQQLAHVMQDLANVRVQKQAQSRNDSAALIGNQVRFQFRNEIQSAPKSGSGFSIGDGYIVTTADVVQGMSNPIVTTDDGRRARAMLVAVDGELNIGLLHLPSALAVPALKLGDSARVAPGHFAISIGNQAGQMNSVSLSLISGTRTQGIASSRHFYPDLLQIDGTMGGGISGAPVLSARGEVIGMWAAALNNEATVSSINGFVNSLVKARQDDDGTVLTPFFASPASLTGILQPMPNDSNAQPELRGQNNSPNAASALPSAKNQPLNAQIYEKSAYNQVSRRKTDDSASAPRGAQRRSGQNAPAIPLSPQNEGVPEVKSNGSYFLGTPANFAGNPNINTPAPSATSGFAIPVNAFKGLIDKLKMGKNIVHVWLGIDLEDVDNAHEANGFVRLDRQVKVRGVYANSPAAKSGGIKIGDILVSLNDTPVHTANEVRSTVLLRFSSGQKIDVNLRRAGKPVSAPLTLEARPTTTPVMLPASMPQNVVPVPSRER